MCLHPKRIRKSYSALSRLQAFADAVLADDSNKYWLVEKTLRNPTHIYEDTEQKYLVYLNTRTYAKRKVIKVVIHPNFKNNGRTYNLLKSIGVVEATKMKSPQYRQIK